MANEQDKVTPNESYEFNSFYTTGESSQFFGMDIFDVYDADEISAMVKEPIIHNRELRKLSNQLYSANGLYTQCVDYCTSLPTLDYVVIPKGRKKRKENKELMNSALKNMKHKELIRDAIFKDMIDGVAFYYCEFSKGSFGKKKTMSDYEASQILELNDLGMNMSVIPLPTDYTKIVGRKNSVYVLAFNLMYFKNCSSDELSRKLRYYPKEIRDKYASWDKTSNNNWIILDETKTIVSKVRSRMEEPWGRPMCLAAIKNILYYSYFTDTKTATLDDLNNQLVYMTLPEGEKKGSCSLTKPQQENLHNNVKTAVMNKNSRGAKSFVTVAAGTKLSKIETDTTIFDEKNERTIQNNIGIDLGFMANLLSGDASGSYSAQQNNLQLLLAEIFMWIESISEEITKVINKNVIKGKYSTELYYLPCSIITRKDFVTQMKELYMNGSGSLRMWISSTGINADAYLELMDSEIEDGFDEKYKPHATSYNTSGDNKGGAPEVQNPTNEITIATKANNGNSMPRPSTM